MRPDDPVDLVAHVVLELEGRLRRPRAEQPVLLARVEAEGVQLSLELAHVVPAEHRRSKVEGSIAEPEPGLDELAPRVRSHDPVDRQTPPALEVPDRRLRG